MSEEAPSRSLILELREDRRSMSEGHGFLEEKSLLLAAEIVRELGRFERLRGAADAAARQASAALGAALGAHGLEELGVLPAAGLGAARLQVQRRSVIGVTVVDAALETDPADAASLPWSSPEARAAREAFLALLVAATALGAVRGNLERLSTEYRKSIRRERALADVLIPEMDQHLGELEARLEDLEREDAIGMHPRR